MTVGGGARRAAGLAALATVVLVVGCSGSDGGGGSASGAGESATGLSAEPSSHCATDHGEYDGLRDYLAGEAADEPWIDRVAVCAGGTIEVDSTGHDEAAAADEALAVCAVAAGYLLTNPPPAERAGAPNPKEIGIIVTDTDGQPMALGSEDELAASGSEAEREREHEREQDAEGAGADATREPEPFRCFDPFA